MKKAYVHLGTLHFSKEGFAPILFLEYIAQVQHIKKEVVRFSICNDVETNMFNICSLDNIWSLKECAFYINANS